MSTVLEEFDKPTVNTAVYFTANITPIVRVNIEVCVRCTVAHIWIIQSACDGF